MPDIVHDYEVVVARPHAENYTARDLLKHYVAEHPHTDLRTTAYGLPLLYEKGKVYVYAGWSIHETKTTDTITIYLREVKPKKGA